ncbi:23S rRNA (pseudouridine(1915)-N(3))-methyltransferase RlmH [Macrococcus capreoli]|uniref:23S rRNA (pseudouridine(1915)-N(3))-methyltransferase RlmH n=1 Tax=Macrococcus capreoli TaxID=2982690 RepID=UPI0021D5DF01|nr:23S rRNA (pseudouridine(1915)-N(3))-methyltransferase RlmH [Macrococcus sp. TMW 2.2395]MCU7557947.1 23S rRNA (pseudouridine(1915)-N(3))-methyltransferase RlmH [Macrococcus sp. TMW 2.2395]
MKITIITVGKLKEKYWKLAVDEYVKRLGAYSKIELIEVADEKDFDNMSEKDIEIAKEKEAQRILARVKDDSFVYTLEILGKQLDSVELSKNIEQKMNTGKSDLTFIIGGSNGLHQSVLTRSNFALSFSKMTFPHQMMKVILLEQVYRAFRIIRGESYHK